MELAENPELFDPAPFSSNLIDRILEGTCVVHMWYVWADYFVEFLVRWCKNLLSVWNYESEADGGF
jgi:hypothetical protein